jgi:hypothetical protein
MSAAGCSSEPSVLKKAQWAGTRHPPHLAGPCRYDRGRLAESHERRNAPASHRPFHAVVRCYRSLLAEGRTQRGGATEPKYFTAKVAKNAKVRQP